MTDQHLTFSPSKRRPVVVWFKRHRARILLWLRLFISVGLMALVIAFVVNDRRKLQNVDWELVPLAFALTMISMVVKALRWSLLVRQSRMNISFSRLLGTYFVGAFFSTVLPTTVGGDAVRAVDMAATTGRLADSTSSVLIERGIGLLAVVGSGSLCALFLEPGAVPLVFLLIVHGMFVGGVIGLVILRQGWFANPLISLLSTLRLGKVAEKARRLQDAFSGHLGRPGVLLIMVALSLLANALTMSAVYIVLIAVTNPIRVMAFVPMISLITTAELIPLSPSAIGIKESAYLFFLGLVGVSNTSAAVIALIMRVMDWGRALTGGIIYLARTLRARREDDQPPDGGVATGGRAGRSTLRPSSNGHSDEPIPEGVMEQVSG